MYHNVVIPLHAEIAAFFGRKNTNFGALSLPATSVCLAAVSDSLYSLRLALSLGCSC